MNSLEDVLQPRVDPYYLEQSDRERRVPLRRRVSDAVVSGTQRMFGIQTRPQERGVPLSDIAEQVFPDFEEHEIRDTTPRTIYGTHPGKFGGPIHGPVHWEQYTTWDRLMSEYKPSMLNKYPMTLKMMDKLSERGFHFVRKLGTGRRGQVWLVEATDLKFDNAGNPVPIQLSGKVLSLTEQYYPWAPSVKESVQELLKEGDVMSELHHPNIVRTEEVIKLYDPESGFPEPIHVCIFTELMDGDLHSLIYQFQLKIRNRARISFEETKNWFKQIVNALNYLHQRNIVHMDIQPRNILFKRLSSGQVVYKLADFSFGIRFPNRESTGQLSIPVGTEGFMAPEVMSGNYLAKPCDIYSLGITLAMSVSRYTDFFIEHLRRRHPNSVAKTFSMRRELVQLLGLMIAEKANARPLIKDIFAVTESQDYESY